MRATIGGYHLSNCWTDRENSMRNVWKGMVVGALVGAGLDLATEAGRRGRVVGRRATERSRELAHTAAEKIESADIPGRTFEKLHDVAG
jgi:hypothetical protein